MAEIKLSICIATLNRADFIGQTLDSIVSQMTENVEIVIVDGASVDATPEIVADFQSKFPLIKYVRLKEKGGVDRDYDRAVEAAQGEYCWLFSDDDLFKPGAIETVLKALEKAPSLVVVNGERITADGAVVFTDLMVNVVEDQEYPSAAQDVLFEKIANYISFIGCVIIRRDIWLSRDRESYYGSLFIHVGVIFQAPLPGASIFIARPIISARHGNAQWTPRYFEIWMFKWPKIIWSFSQFSDALKQKVFAREPWRRPGALLICRAKACYGLKEYERFIAPQSPGAFTELVSKAVAVSPGVLTNAMALLFFRIFRPKALGEILDFQNGKYNWRRLLDGKR